MNGTAKPTGPLTGVKIIELAGIGPGPLCCALLSDMGADILRIDRNIDPKLGIGRPTKTDVTRRGRLSISVDLKHKDGIAAVLRLVAGADRLHHLARNGRIGDIPRAEVSLRVELADVDELVESEQPVGPPGIEERPGCGIHGDSAIPDRLEVLGQLPC